MIEEALRRQFQPIADRRRHLYLARRFALCWSILGLIGLGLLGAGRLWVWRSWPAIWMLVVAVLATVWIILRSRRLQPDYRALARDIEHHHPELQALLLAAVEQRPRGPDGQFGYMQRQVIADAVTHATGHDWSQGIPTRKLVLADLTQIAAMVFLMVILSQALPSTSLLGHRGGVPAGRYQITVTPGDTEVEQGAPVVILARFEGRVPPGAELLFGPPGQEPQRMTLTRSLDDPVFGGIIQDVRADLLYRIEFAGKRTRDYRVSVYRSPELLRADAKIVYPAYTKLREKTIEDTRQISVVEGSEVTLTFTLNKPVTTARLVPKAGIALGLSVDSQDPNVLTASVTAVQSERYELQMADAQGRTNKMPPRFVIDVHQNLPPELTPVFPNRDVVVSPLEELALEAEVSDDYGVTGYGLTYMLAGTEDREITLDGGESSDEKQSIQHLLALEDLKAQPDQLLTYYFWADDVGPDGRPRRTASDMYFAEVRPFEEIFRESQSFQGQQEQQEGQQGEQQERPGEQLARLQKQIISATWNIKQQAARSGGTAGNKGDLDVVRESQAGALEQAKAASAQAEDPSAAQSLQAAAGYMETALDHLTEAAEAESASELTPALGAEQSAYQELLKLRQREHQIAQGRSASRAGRANSAQFEQQLQQLELTQREDRYETQRMAQSREQTGRQEDLQVLNRLRDLARRQNEMSDRLREAEAALRQARNEQEREEALRELRRLRDEQLAALRDVDELQQRMENPQNRRRMADARQRLDESRAGIRESAEALEQGMVSRAISSATRAQRELEQMRDEFRRRTSSQFSDQMREMRDDAQQLDEQQKQIAEEIDRQIDARQKTLTGSNANRELADRIDRQRENMERLIEQMKDISEQAEASEPLLSKELYDTLRNAGTENLDKVLQATGELLRRNFLPQAQDIERRAGEGIEEIREGVEEAARSVLGDESESLRLARAQLDELIRQADEEAIRAARAGRPRPGDANEPTDAAGERRQANAQSGARDNPEQDPDGQQQPGTEGTARAESDAQQRSAPRPPSDRGQNARDTQAGQGGAPRDGERRQASNGGRRAQADIGDRARGAERPDGWGGNPGVPEQWEDAGARGPFTGEDFIQWSENLRDVEEMLTERDLREEAARVWDRARAVRAEFKRHGTEPQWDLVRDQIIEPLTELRGRVSDRLAQLQSDETLVPIDRDPVPDRFAELVRTYFENLGRDDQ